MKYGITEQSRGAKGNHESIEILVDAVELVVLVEEREKEYTKQRAGTDQGHHQKTIPIGCESVCVCVCVSAHVHCIFSRILATNRYMYMFGI